MNKTITAILLGAVFVCACLPLAAKPIAAKTTEVTVSSTEEFLRAIAPNTVIRISTDEYEPIVFDGMDSESVSRYCSFEQVFDGVQLAITGVNNLTITGSQYGQARFLSPYSYANVFHFVDCEDISLQWLNCGHDVEGYCTGGVLAFDNCRNVRIENCELWGCGIEGLSIYDSSGFECVSTTIRDCSYSIMTVYNSSDLKFQYCLMHDNREFDMMSFRNSSRVRFENCAIWNNQAVSSYGIPYELVKATGSDVRFNKCAIFNNNVDTLSSSDTVKFLSCTIFNNAARNVEE